MKKLNAGEVRLRPDHPIWGLLDVDQQDRFYVATNGDQDFILQTDWLVSSLEEDGGISASDRDAHTNKKFEFVKALVDALDEEPLCAEWRTDASDILRISEA